MAVELGDELADGRVGERGLPAAVGEVLAGILLRPAGSLHHTASQPITTSGDWTADCPARPAWHCQ
jgi:hypothetical protein